MMRRCQCRGVCAGPRAPECQTHHRRVMTRGRRRPVCARRAHSCHRVCGRPFAPGRVTHAPDEGIPWCWPLGHRLGPLLEFTVSLQLAWQ